MGTTPKAQQQFTPDAFAARAYAPSLLPNKSSASGSTKGHTTNTMIGIHRTKNGRKYISHNNTVLSPKAPLCQLCFNKLVNPWHPTDNCPYKHPTQIIPKDVRERIVQHNALHGAEKKDYNKNQDVKSSPFSPPPAAGNHASVLDPSHLPVNSTDLDTTESPPPADSTSTMTSDDTLHHESDEIINTEYFDIPFPPATANAASTSTTLPYEDIDSDSIITDHLQYLSYDS